MDDKEDRLDSAAESYARMHQKYKDERKVVAASTQIGFIVAIIGGTLLLPKGQQWQVGIAFALIPVAIWLYRRWERRQDEELEADIRWKLGELSMEQRADFFDRVGKVQKERRYSSGGYY